jgi:hypothetical protein
MVTADTITDEQIRVLRRDLHAQLRVTVAGDIATRIERADMATECDTALTTSAIPQEVRNAARARCVEIINAREASKAVR